MGRFNNQPPKLPGGNLPLIGAPTTAHDRHGRILHQGDLVIFPNPDPTFRVHSIAPCLTPGVPPGTVTVLLVAQMQLRVAGGQPVVEIVRTLSAAEQGLAVPPAGTDGADEKQTTIEEGQ